MSKPMVYLETSFFQGRGRCVALGSSFLLRLRVRSDMELQAPEQCLDQAPGGKDHPRIWL